ncbi:hypothetical protein GCM10027289_19990 [Tsukamurella serpentis]
MRARVLIVVGVLALLAAVGWNLLAPSEVSRGAVESGTLAQVSAAPSDSLTCDGGLTARVGATQSCTLTRAGERFRVNLRVTDVGDGGIRWNSTVAGEPQAGPRVTVDELERHTREALAQQRPVEKVTCAGPLEGTVAATQSCTLLSRGVIHHVTVKVTTVDDSRVQWGATVVD